MSSPLLLHPHTESRVRMDEMRNATGAIERQMGAVQRLGFTGLAVCVEGSELWGRATFADDVGLGAHEFIVWFPVVHGRAVNQMASAMTALCVVLERGR